MIYKSENHIRFDRENKILYEVILNKGVEQSVPLFIFEQYFPDIKDLKQSAIKYLKDYMLDYPTLWKEAKEVGIERQQEIFSEIDSLKNDSYDVSESILNEIMPEAFAVVKETATRFVKNNEVEAL